MKKNLMFYASSLMIKTRLAPAPTGKLHIGTARTALFNYLFSRKSGGVFVVRIEDTDRERSRKEFEDDILENLKWLGLEWDELYRQSERISIYRKYIEKLLEEGRAYYCYHGLEETRGTVHFCEYREWSEQKFKVPLPERAVLRRQSCSKFKVIRFKTPKDREVEFEDIVRGKVRFNTNEIGDFSVAKSPNEPLWILAVTVDDYEMSITHVIRGEDHISNTPKQILLHQAFGFTPPAYAHLPLILGPDRAKLSKRHGATAISEFRDKGYLPEALMNMMAFLGWNPGDEREFFTLGELIKEFSLERVKKGGALFNRERLDYLNRHYLRRLPLQTIAHRAKPFFEARYGKGKVKDFKFLQNVVGLERERAKTLMELAEAVDFIFKLPQYESTLLHWKKERREEVKNYLERSFQAIEKIGKREYNETRLKELLLTEARRVGAKGSLLWPLRVALSGKKVSPGPFEIAATLGKRETLRRIRYALNLCSD